MENPIVSQDMKNDEYFRRPDLYLQLFPSLLKICNEKLIGVERASLLLMKSPESF